MIHKVGLLPACNHQQVPFAYKMYTKADPVGWEQSNLFKKTFSNDVDIEFLGVWSVLFISNSLSPPPSFLLLTFSLYQGFCQLSWIDTTSFAICGF